MTAHGRSSRLAQVESQVNYHRQRLELYVRLHTDKPCQRLTQLEEAVRGAEQRLAQHARTAEASAEG
jgi:hypothetical protein